MARNARPSPAPSATLDALLGLALMHWRTARGESQVSFSKMTGVRQSWISRVESGRIPLTVSRLTDLCDKLNIGAARLVGDASGFAWDLRGKLDVSTDRNTQYSLTAAQINHMLLAVNSVTIRSIYADSGAAHR